MKHANAATPGILSSPATWVALLVAVIVGTTAYLQYDREKTRQRIERERVAAEQAEAERQREIEERREREKKRFAEEMRIQKEAEEAQRQLAMQQRLEENQQKVFTAGERPPTNAQAAMSTYYAVQDQRRKEYEERRERYEQDYAAYKARSEVERQKRYVQQREWEEQAARYRRDANARYGN